MIWGTFKTYLLTGNHSTHHEYKAVNAITQHFKKEKII